MNCFTDHENGMEILLDYCSGTLPAEKSERVAMHARQCPECQRLIDAQRAVFTSLEEFVGPDVSDDFDRRLYTRIAQDNQQPAWKRWLGQGDFMQWWKPTLAGGFAAAVLAVVLIVPVRRETPTEDAGRKQTRIEHVDMEQVEQALEDLDLLAPQPSSGPM